MTQTPGAHPDLSRPADVGNAARAPALSATWTAPLGPIASMAGGLAAMLVTLLILVGTEPYLAMVYDEGYTLAREALVRDWLRGMRDPREFAETWRPPSPDFVKHEDPTPTPGSLDARSKLLRPQILKWFWPFGREEPHGHPPFYAIVGLLGDGLVSGWDELPRARFGPMLAFSLAGGGIFLFFARRWGLWPALTAASAWCFQPNLFALAHYATYDGLLSSLWVGAILAFAQAVEPKERANGGARPTPRWAWVIVFGLLVGWAADTKFTGWFLPVPFLAWTVLARERRGVWALAVGGAVAALTLYVFNPPWWPDPIDGVRRFLQSNLTRGQSQVIWVQFLGRAYESPRQSLPWYNTLVWTVFVTPVGFLGLALAGAGRAIARRRTEPFGMLALTHWVFFLILRALPKTPGHDGVRQFLPAFGCLALMVGLGAVWATQRLGRFGRAAVVASLAEGVVSVAILMPVPLSYFSPLVGGLPGATALGMEPTYYWDSFSDEPLDWLNRHTTRDQAVVFPDAPVSWFYLREWGKLRGKIFPFEPAPIRWYVLQNRPGTFSARDRALIARSGPRHVAMSKFGVPLLWFFPFEDFKAVSETNDPAQAPSSEPDRRRVGGP